MALIVISKSLKEEIFKLTQMNGMISPHSVEGWIDKLAGDKLI